VSDTQLSPAAAKAEIEAAIPHREPFLLVDRVVEREGERLVARWRVDPAGPWFAGHYPGRPVLPGALTCEHVFQVGALFVAWRLGGTLNPADGVPVLTRVEAARFKRMVEPADELETTVTLREVLGPAWFFSGVVRRVEPAGAGAKVLDVRFCLSASEAMSRVDGA